LIQTDEDDSGDDEIQDLRIHDQNPRVLNNNIRSREIDRIRDRERERESAINWELLLYSLNILSMT